ncbi:hypothetical protein ACFP1I_29045 [Dyadobacter subterraneus]|uniref:DUF4198 domain-containing protein n=1 Tax=Dyadobacter subterraneus TaxID=2773304 RepID=A0ABR9WGX8_9BACT|nr:hypothetical protein [Dyadobacter subterraneus]MBE9463414.1 hypothetical protein [Dyadobacter subterraneus]
MKIINAFLLLCLSITCEAHGYWFDIKGSGKINSAVRIQVCYGEIDEFGVRHREKGAELPLSGDFKVFVMNGDGKRFNLKLKPRADCWETTFTPLEKGYYQILAINETLPVVDRSAIKGKNVRPVDFLCAGYNVESKVETAQSYQFLDIITSKKEKLVVVRAFKENVPVDSTTKLRVFNPENWEKSLSVNEKGEAVFMPTMKGLYIIRQDWTEPKSGTYKGVAYSGIRYRCNYCLLIE